MLFFRVFCILKRKITRACAPIPSKVNHSFLAFFHQSPPTSLTLIRILQKVRSIKYLSNKYACYKYTYMYVENTFISKNAPSWYKRKEVNDVPWVPYFYIVVILKLHDQVYYKEIVSRTSRLSIQNVHV